MTDVLESPQVHALLHSVCVHLYVLGDVLGKLVLTILADRGAHLVEEIFLFPFALPALLLFPSPLPVCTVSFLTVAVVI